MGEDIHQKSFAKSKITGKWISTSEVDFDAIPYLFEHLVPYRSYMVYSLFGSRRADWDELPASGWGIPDFIAKDLPAFAHYHATDKGDWYGYVWFTRKQLKEGIENYIKRLESPEKYCENYDEDDKNNFLDDVHYCKEAEDAWKEEAGCLKELLQEMLDKLNNIIEFRKEMEKEIDVDGAIYLFWFDN
jgi:hypothetical protein